MKVICTNKRATFEYFILEKYEAGIKLKGTEIKAIREGHCNINDAYVIMKNNRPWIVNMFIAKYEFGNIFNHDELRSRELLLHKKECIKLAARIKQEGLTLVALRCYFEGSLVKVEIGLAKGKKLQDKREAIKEKDAKIRMEKEYKNSYR
ncbi:MAG: SsrA-binding protein SmpB [Acholeplasmatales bacterium]|jgi:SsrA-binding protein|nr:SsrA-binding protein SmpB [Acholeplasmatales bacterium]MBQ4356842.1 SsrA-binding protein SmpB [Acholeplasmatales bacterium]